MKYGPPGCFVRRVHSVYWLNSEKYVVGSGQRVGLEENPRTYVIDNNLQCMKYENEREPSIASTITLGRSPRTV